MCSAFIKKPNKSVNASLSYLESDKENALVTRIKKAAETLTDEEIQSIFVILNKYTLPSDDKERYISYPLFNEARKHLCAKAQKILTPVIFAKLSKPDQFSRVKLSDFNQYVCKMTWLNRTRFELSKYDENDKGYLVESELERYIKNQIPFLHQIKNIERWFIPYYLCTVSRRFFFFLDPVRVGRVRICDVMASGLLESFQALGSMTCVPSENNHFTLSSVKRVYDMYIQLDLDKNGSLSRDEIIRMRTDFGHISNIFVDFFFATHPSKNGAIDYRTYMDLVLALENRETTQSIRYLFNTFDVEGHGKLKISRIEALFNESDKESGSKDFRDFYCFIYDTFKIEDPEYITLNDLLKSGQGHVFLSTFIDDDTPIEEKSEVSI